jgi:23S rRNA-/tRNA-specific pseudouridylate synthase
MIDAGSAVLPIIYQDQHLVAIHKPAGLLVHRSLIDRSERRFALQMLRDQLGQRVYAVHRLDKGTSGVLLFALSSAVGRALSTSFEQRQVGKNYLAVVRGHPPLAGEIDHPLASPLRHGGRSRAAAATADLELADAGRLHPLPEAGHHRIAAPRRPLSLESLRPA